MDGGPHILSVRYSNLSGVDFTIVLRAAFTRRSQKHKKTVKLSIFFMLLGSLSAKAARRMLMKLTSGIDFTNVLWAAFTNADP